MKFLDKATAILSIILCFTSMFMTAEVADDVAAHYGFYGIGVLFLFTIVCVFVAIYLAIRNFG